MRRKGFTLVELLVVIGIIAVLMGILLPALNAVKRAAQRVVCGTSLGGIGKSMLIYANDYEGEFPRAGGPRSEWSTTGEIADWDSLIGTQYGRMPGADVTITSSLYLLIRGYDVAPEQFVCKGDVGTKVFKLSDAEDELDPAIEDVTDVWDFGQHDELVTDLWPGQYNSYAYHSPYENEDDRSFPLNSYSNPVSPVCADRNPYLDRNADSYIEGEDCAGTDERCLYWDEGYQDPDRTGNSACHQREGQNVLFCDGHTSFERYPNVGISKDNIWKCWDEPDTPPETADEREGAVDPYSPYCPSLTDDGQGGPGAERDAYLVSERNDEDARTTE
jgi:prepilin-type N-terminal cleavage/methylation domain-containing protein/prepilin-type processing-associated H-X9-DG protein